jgi:tetratricopeptide (TPR) repeat protein
MKTFFTRFHTAPYMLVLLILVTIAACTSTHSLINTGNFDQAIARTVNKLRKNKNKPKQVLLLQEAYEKANRRDLDRIEFLKQEGAAGNAVEVFNLYTQIQQRQDKIKPLMPLYVEGSEVPFTFLNINRQLIAWKEEAATFLYDNAIRLLETGNKYQAREAYDQLVELKQMSPYYRDVDQQLDRAYDMGMNWVLFNVVNRSPNIIPMEFVDQLYSLDFSRLNGKWFTLVTMQERRRMNNDFDHRIDIVLDIVEVGPEQVKEVRYEEKKEIEDGFVYQLDDNGNVMKDSAGNDIKIAKYKEITAQIVEMQQTKAATFRGRLQIYAEPGNSLLQNDPMSVNFLFNHFSATAVGNLDALKEETRKKLQSKPVPFPTDFQMIMDGSQEIQPAIQHFIRRYARLLEG